MYNQHVEQTLLLWSHPPQQLQNFLILLFSYILRVIGHPYKYKEFIHFSTNRHIRPWHLIRIIVWLTVVIDHGYRLAYLYIDE